MSPIKGTVLVTGSSLVPDEVCSYIESRGYAVRRVAQDNFSAEELAAALEGVEGYLIGGYEEPLADHFDRATKLKAVAWVGTDYKAYVPGWSRACELGIAFLNSPGTNAISVAEFTMLLVLTMMRPFTQRIAEHGEPVSELTEPGRDLYRRKLGIIGFGRIGGRLARMAKLGFDMDVVYSAPRRNESLEYSLGVAHVDKRELLRDCDIISIHRPGPTPGDGFELGAGELQILKPGAIVINTAHHQLIDLSALADVIESKGVRAAFDGVASGEVWDRLLSFGPERFLAVPSMAFNTEDANLRAGLVTAEGVCDVLDGGTSEHVNNPDFREVRGTRR